MSFDPDAPTQVFETLKPEDDPARFTPAKKQKMDLAQMFWMVIFGGLILALLLPLWFKAVVKIAAWSWGLIG